MSTKGAKVAELFTKVMATTKCFDQNLRQVKDLFTYKIIMML